MPAAHPTQTTFDDAPNVEDHDPATQLIHSLRLDAADNDDHVPLGQFEQRLDELAPTAVDHIPTTHD